MPLIMTGIPEVRSALKNLEDGTAEAIKGSTGVGSTLPYAYGIEYGQHRGGKPARRAGGAFYMRGALQKITPEIPRRLGAALEHGPDRVRKEKQAIAEDMTEAAQVIVPVRSGRLRSSLSPIYPGGPSPLSFTQPTARGYRGATRLTHSTLGRGIGGRLR